MKVDKSRSGFTLMESVITTLLIILFFNFYYIEIKNYDKHERFFKNTSLQKVNFDVISYRENKKSIIELSIK